LIQKILLAIAFIFLYQSNTLGQNFKLKGMITNENEKPLENIAVTIKNINELVFTNEAGYFTIENIPKGNHSLIVNAYSENEIVFDVFLDKDTVLPEPIIIDAQIVQFDEVEVIKRKAMNSPIESLPILEVDFHEIRREIGGSLMQTLEKLPGIKSIGIGSSNSKPLIRGLGFNQVVVVENGIKHEGQQWGADHGLEIDQYSIDKLEIIKGPTSFLYGSDALGGIIDIKSNTAPLRNTFGGSVDLVGKSNNLHFGSSLNMFGRNDKWFFNFRTSYMDYADYRVPTDTVYIYSYGVSLKDNFVRNSAGKELNSSIHFGYLDTKVRSIFSVSNTFNRSGFFANAHGITPTKVDDTIYDASNRDILLPYQQVNHLKVSNQTNFSLGEHQISIESGYQQNLRSEYGLYLAHGYMPTSLPDELNNHPNLERGFNKNTISLKIHDKINLGKHELNFGANGQYEHNKIGGWGFLIPNYSFYQLGAFIFDNYDITNHLTLSAALRFDYGKTNIKAYYDWFESEVVINGNTYLEKLQKADEFSKDFSSLSWSAGLVYHKNDFGLHLNVGKSFRMPIAKELAASGVNYHYFRYEKGNQDLSPEQSYQLDLGIHIQKRAWNIHFTPFVNYFTNFIFLNPTANYDTYYGAGNQIFEYTQAQVFRAGFELTAEYKPIKQVKLETGFEYLYNIQMSGAKKYYPLPFSPPTSGIVSISYEPNLWEKRLKNTFFKVNVRLTAEQNEIVPPEKITPSHHIWGLSLGTSIKMKKNAIDVSLNVYNLFNQKYLNHISFYRLIDLPEQGRNFVLSIKIPFDFKK